MLKDGAISIGDETVNLLIGQDVPQALEPLEVKSGRYGHPFAVRTRLGWTLNGPMEMQVESGLVSQVLCSVGGFSLEGQVRALWEVENLEGEMPTQSAEDRKVLALWQIECCQVEGHYEFPIPFRDEDPKLPNNRIIAERRL